MLRHILPNIPEHTIYTESFFGGGAVYFSKEPSKLEVINDVNREAINYYYQVKVNNKQLAKEVTSTMHSRSAYDDAKIVYTHPHLFTNVKRAWAFYTISNQSFSSNLSTFGYDRSGSTAKKVFNKAERYTQQLAERMKLTTIENDDALKVIARYDTSEAFHYVDPPYFNSDCGHYAGYSSSDFKTLLELLSNIKGKFLLSSYDSDILKEFIHKGDFHQIFVEKQVAVSGKFNKKKVEVLTANYPLNAVR